MQYKRTLHQITNFVLTLLVVLAPILTTILFLKVIINSNLSAYQPSWNDEVGYWQEINTFRVAGFIGGYFSYEEMLPLSSYFHFGTHGPAFPIIMGSLARIFGWSFTSGPWYNIAFLTIALGCFLFLTKPDNKGKVFILLSFLVVFTIHFYIPSNMQESLIQSLTIILTGVFIQLVRNRHSLWMSLCGIICAALLSILKVNFVLVFFPLIFLLKERRNRKWFLISAGISSVISIFFILLFAYWTSPYPYLFLYEWTHLEPFGIRKFVRFFVEHFFINLRDYFSLAKEMNVMEILQRYTSIILIVFLGFLVGKKKTAYIYPLFILLSQILATFALNTVGRLGDLRIISPFLIFSLFFVSGFLQEKSISLVFSIIFIMNIICFPLFVNNYKELFVGIHFPKDNLVTSSSVANLVYRPEENPWCNTILTDDVATPYTLSVPGGMGVGVIMYLDHLNLPVKAHYIFISPDKFSLIGLTDNVKILAIEKEKVLYARTDDGCIP